MIGPKPTSLELFLACTLAKAFGTPNPSRTFNRSRLGEPDPLTHFAFLTALGAAWMFAYVILEFVWLGVWGALYGTHVVGHGILAPVFLFIGVFCIVAVVDVWWRYTLVWAARGRWQRSERTLDATASRFMRLAQLNDGTIFVQVAVGLVFALHVWSRI